MDDSQRQGYTDCTRAAREPAASSVGQRTGAHQVAPVAAPAAASVDQPGPRSRSWHIKLHPAEGVAVPGVAEGHSTEDCKEPVEPVLGAAEPELQPEPSKRCNLASDRGAEEDQEAKGAELDNSAGEQMDFCSYLREYIFYELDDMR